VWQSAYIEIYSYNGIPILLYAMRAQSGGGGGCVGVGCLMRILVPALIDKGKRSLSTTLHVCTCLQQYEKLFAINCNINLLLDDGEFICSGSGRFSQVPKSGIHFIFPPLAVNSECCFEMEG
jgi:hypothetical protein